MGNELVQIKSKKKKKINYSCVKSYIIELNACKTKT